MPVGREVQPWLLQSRARKDSGRATKKTGSYEWPPCRLGWNWELGGQRSEARAPRLQTVLSTHSVPSPNQG